MNVTDEQLLQPQTSETPNRPPRRQRKVVGKILLLLLIAMVLAAAAMYYYNNVSMMSDDEFTRRLDVSLDRALEWTKEHRADILKKKNIALLRMLQDADEIKSNTLLSGIVYEFMAAPVAPVCWKRLLDPHKNISAIELNQTIKNEYIDNKWILYALDPEKAELTEKQMKDFFNGDIWQGRQLTHQLWALIHLRDRQGDNEELNNLIEHLCNRITGQLPYNIAVVDIYFQKNAFVMKAGFPEKINRRWLERIIENQLTDGGWNDRWYCFQSPRRPLFTPQPPSNQHATVQALWLLYQVKYRYPEHFGVIDN